MKSQNLHKEIVSLVTVYVKRNNMNIMQYGKCNDQCGTVNVMRHIFSCNNYPVLPYYFGSTVHFLRVLQFFVYLGSPLGFHLYYHRFLLIKILHFFFKSFKVIELLITLLTKIFLCFFFVK